MVGRMVVASALARLEQSTLLDMQAATPSTPGIDREVTKALGAGRREDQRETACSVNC